MSFRDDLFKSFLVLLQSQEVWNIAALSLLVSITAVMISTIIGVPLGVWLGYKKKCNNKFVITILNSGMGLPPVLIGLIVFLLLSREGSLGELQLLFTPLAMIFAQSILTLPIIIGLTRSNVSNISEDLFELLDAMGATKNQQIIIIIKESSHFIFIAIMLALGRAISEVGAILIVGGNIRFHTRVLTTAIITEISKGNNEIALALGLILLLINYMLTLVLTTAQIRVNQ